MKQLTILVTAFLFSLTNLTAQCPSFTIDSSTVDPTCPGLNDGTISIMASPISGPSTSFVYELFNNGGSRLDSVGPLGGAQTFINLYFGDYYIVTTHPTYGCTDTTFFTLIDPIPMVFINNVTDITCSGNCDGTITGQVIGGVDPINYDYYSQAPNSYLSSGPSISNLCAGQYYVVATDANYCVMDIYETINEPLPITVSETITDDNGSTNGSISLTVTGGANGYTYYWTGPNGYTATTQNISNLSAGVYTVNVTDYNGCTTSSTYTVASNSAMTTSFWTMDPMCAGGADGGVQVNINGGTGSYTFEVLDPSDYLIYSSNTVDYYYGLPAGTYYYVVTDLGTNDTDTNYFDLYDAFPVYVTETVTDASCGQCNGAISLNVTGGVTPYSVSWSNGSTTFNQSGLCAGTYTVEIYDANGCYSIYTYVINNAGGTAFTGTTSSTDATCSNCDGAISFTPNGGTAPYSYMWDDPTNQTTNNGLNLCPGIYTLSVTDATGCTMAFTDTVNSGSLVTGSITNMTNTSCLACTGTAQFSATGGIGPYYYVNPVTQDTNTTGYFDSLCSGVQYIEIWDAAGCSEMMSYTISELGLPGLNYSSVITDESIATAYDGSINISYDANAYPNLTFLWSPWNATSEDIMNLTTGNYSVTMTDPVSGGCESHTETVGSYSSYGYIGGIIYEDLDGDCSYSSGEYGLSNILVTVTDGTNNYSGLTGPNGTYTILVPNGTYTVTASSPSGYSANCGTTTSTTVNGQYSIGNNFGFNAPPFEDLCTYVSSWGFVPGFTAYAYVYFSNYGNTVSSGEITVELPAGVDYLGSDLAPTSINGNILTFTLNGIAPSFTSYISIGIGVPTWFQIGDPIVLCSTIDLLGGGTDINLACNNNCYVDVVSGSYDPNDKAVQPHGTDSPGYVETNVDEFTYTIRFQNTGTAAAHNVYITDTLDAMLDRNTLSILAASHDYSVEFYQNDVVRFRFDSIMLPDSNSNEPESHGFIQFKINTLNTPQLTETVQNTANIYFDFNEPVITNTTLNTYADFSSVAYDEEMGLQLYPNPTNGILYTTIEESVSYKIFDLEGKMIMNGRLVAFEGIDVNQLTNGLYFVEISTSTGIIRDKFIKQ